MLILFIFISIYSDRLKKAHSLQGIGAAKSMNYIV